MSGRLERIVDPSQNMIIGIIMDHLVIQAKLKLCIHGADLDWEDLAHLLPPDHQLLFFNSVGVELHKCERKSNLTQPRRERGKGIKTQHICKVKAEGTPLLYD